MQTWNLHWKPSQRGGAAPGFVVLWTWPGSSSYRASHLVLPRVLRGELGDCLVLRHLRSLRTQLSCHLQAGDFAQKKYWALPTELLNWASQSFHKKLKPPNLLMHEKDSDAVAGFHWKLTRAYSNCGCGCGWHQTSWLQLDENLKLIGGEYCCVLERSGPSMGCWIVLSDPTLSAPLYHCIWSGSSFGLRCVDLQMLVGHYTRFVDCY